MKKHMRQYGKWFNLDRKTFEDLICQSDWNVTAEIVENVSLMMCPRSLWAFLYVVIMSPVSAKYVHYGVFSVNTLFIVIFWYPAHFYKVFQVKGGPVY